MGGAAKPQAARRPENGPLRFGDDAGEHGQSPPLAVPELGSRIDALLLTVRLADLAASVLPGSERPTELGSFG